MKRKIVKVTHRNGEVDYTIKKRILPFIWVTDSFDNLFYTVMLRGMPLEDAEKYIESFNRADEEYKGAKVIKKETYKVVKT